MWLGVATTAGIAQQAAPAPAKPVQAPAAAPRTPKGPAKTAPATPAANASAPDHNGVIRRYCVSCHSDARKTGGLSLASFDVSHAAQNAEVAEKVIRKLQAGMMPPPLSPRPDAATQAALITALETTVDAAALGKPNPGGAHVPAPQSSRVRARRARSARPRRRRRQLAAARSEERELRQHRRRRRRCRRRCSRPTSTPPRRSAGWRSAIATRRRSTPPTPTPATSRSTRGITSRARRTARAAAWSSTTCSRPTPSTSSRSRSTRAATRASRTSTSRSTASASR